MEMTETVDRQLLSTYDAHNRTATIVQDNDFDDEIDAGEPTTTYTYDLAGNIRKITQPDGDTIERTYDFLGRTSLIEGEHDAEVDLYTYTLFYDLFGNLAQQVDDYPANLTDRTVTLTYDGADGLKVESIDDGTDVIVSTYTYDDAHNRTYLEILENGSEIDENKGYLFTGKLNQIQKVYEDLDADGFWDSGDEPYTEYTYYATGSRKARIEKDKDGNILVDDDYYYDDENRLTSLVRVIGGTELETYTYAYDYRTRRVERDNDGTETKVVFSGGTSVQERDATTGNLQAEYIRGSDYGGGVGGILYSIRGGDASYNHYNGRGDVVAQTDDTGSLTYQAAYEAFGSHDGADPRTQESGSSADPHRANTKEEDPTGLLNEGFRYRDLEAGVFITRDPLGFVDGPNVYAYVVQNPWSGFDPTGLAAEDFQRRQAILDSEGVGPSEKQKNAGKQLLSNLKTGTDIAAGATPIGALSEFASGETATGDSLAWWEQGLAFFGIGIPAGKAAGAVRVTNSAADIKRTTELTVSLSEVRKNPTAADRVIRLASAFGLDEYIKAFGRSTDSGAIQMAQDMVKRLGFEGKLEVLRYTKGGTTAGGITDEGAMVLFDHKVRWGHRIPRDKRFLSGEGVIAHEIGHTLVTDERLLAHLDLRYRSSIWWEREWRASEAASQLSGISSEAKKLLIRDAAIARLRHLHGDRADLSGF